MNAGLAVLSAPSTQPASRPEDIVVSTPQVAERRVALRLALQR